jgi:hypothetical protein
MANHPRLVPRPLPIDESRLERRDHTNIQSHRPNRSTLDRSLSRDRSVARARASVVASVVARDDATEETMGGYDIPKAFSFIVTARAPIASSRVVHRTTTARADRISLARARPFASSVARRVARDDDHRRSTRKKHCTYLDLGRLEGGDAADEGGSEESRHCSRVQE